MIKKLRVKFVCIIMLIVTLLLGVSFTLVLRLTQRNLEQSSVLMMQSVAENRFDHIGPATPGASVRLPYFTLEIRTDTEGERYLFAVQSDWFDLSDDTVLEALYNAASSGEKTGLLRDYSLRYYRAQIPFGEKIIFSDASSELDTMRSLMRSCLLIGAAGLAAFLLLSVLLARWAVGPVETAWRQQRQFVADASHELKTPLTVILTNAELLQDGGYDAEEKRRFSDNILTMSRQMRGLVESLLELARVDNGAVAAAFTEVDLSAVVSETVLPFEPVFFEKGLTLTSDIAPGVTLRGNEAYLRQVAEILLDNAQKYARGGSTVTLSLAQAGHGHCLLRVESAGEEISQEDLKNIFKRFYRVDKARSMNHSYGLGLPIAQSIVQEHRGRIWAESEGGVNTFFVQLPTL